MLLRENVGKQEQYCHQEELVSAHSLIHEKTDSNFFYSSVFIKPKTRVWLKSHQVFDKQDKTASEVLSSSTFCMWPAWRLTKASCFSKCFKHNIVQKTKFKWPQQGLSKEATFVYICPAEQPQLQGVSSWDRNCHSPQLCMLTVSDACGPEVTCDTFKFHV